MGSEWESKRHPDAYGTELPIAHEKDFASPRLHLYDVPIGPAVRTKLRVYSLDPPQGDAGEVSVTITRAGTNRIAAYGHRLRWTRPPCLYEACMPAYAELDLDPSLLAPELAASGRFDLNFWTSYADAWAFVTVVDNKTQSVAVVSPR